LDFFAIAPIVSIDFLTENEDQNKKMHDTPNVVIKARWREFKANWRRLSCGTWVGIIIYGTFLVPFILEGFSILVALSVLIPLGIVFAVIKHKLPYFWIIVAIFVTLGGLADVSTDLILLGKVLYNYYTGHSNFEQEEGESDLEFVLQVSRVFITFITGKFQNSCSSSKRFLESSCSFPPSICCQI